MKKWVILLVFGTVLVVPALAAKIRKCFACRSRGEQGDCRDPFFVSANATLLESKSSGVEMPPCASGWCSKIIEGRDNLHKDAEYGVATERDCLQRPPSDGKERCATIRRQNKQVFMCFCKGHLCNSSGKIQNQYIMSILALVVVAYNVL